MLHCGKKKLVTTRKRSSEWDTISTLAGKIIGQETEEIFVEIR
jgi:hypothetical protein